jgi:hypothetical protein
LVACSSTSADVTAAELRAIVDDEAIAVDHASLPTPVTDLLTDHRVVLLGETHHLREHWEFVAQLMDELYDDGFRQLLIEAPQMAGWLLDDYVLGSPEVPEWTPPPFYERRLSSIRELNRDHPDDPVRVHGIDANEEVYGGASDFELLLGWFLDTLPTRGPADAIIELPYSTADASRQRQEIEDVLRSLEADRTGLAEAWGSDDYERLVDLLTAELASIDVRAARLDDDDRGARRREEVIKQLADDRIEECSCGTVVNIGGHHAQKAPLMGTDQEWLGDYLAHRSDVVDGSIVVIGVSSARTDLEPGAGGTSWDVVHSESPDNELRRTMAEAMPGETVFLSLDDPVFAERTIAYNSEDVIYVTALGRQFDAVLQYGHAHRMPIE